MKIDDAAKKFRYQLGLEGTIGVLGCDTSDAHEVAERAFRQGWTGNPDQTAIDSVADILAEPEWSGADFLEWIADVIGTVRPHPGGHPTREAYAKVFLEATGRDAIEHDDDEEDEEDEDVEACAQCGDGIDESDPHAGYGMCASCLHNAQRSGWTPGEEN